MTSFLINARWIDIPERAIYETLSRSGGTLWHSRLFIWGEYLYSLEGYAYPYSLPRETILRLVSALNGAEPMFDWKAKVNELKDKPHYNNATQYGVIISSPQTSKWLTSVYHLSPEENQGGHYIYIEVLCKQGDRAFYQPVLWGWEGMTDQEKNQIGAIYADKPDYEIKSHPIWSGQRIWLEVAGGDKIINLSTMIDPDEGTGNTRFHHSYLVLFQEVDQSQPPPDPGPDPEPPPSGDTVSLTGRLLVKVNQTYVAGLAPDDRGNVMIEVDIAGQVTDGR